jgi:hypothetical protein
VISVELHGMEAFQASIDGWMREAEAGATKAIKKLSKDTLRHLAENSPQFPGDFASTWVYELNVITPKTPSKVSAVKVPLFAGAPTAVAAAMSANYMAEMAFNLGDTIYLHNTSAHPYLHRNYYGDLDYYAWKIENNQINFRVGTGNGPEVVGRTMRWLERKAGKLNFV